MYDIKQLSGLQLRVMQAVWSRGEASVAEVQNALQRERGLAMTTVATVLSRLEKRGFLTHRAHGRQFVYRATVSEGEVRERLVAEITDRLFDGNVGAFVSHLLRESDISEGDLGRMKELIRERESKKRSRSSNGGGC
jgi:predicted transcriptional regulator